MSHPARNPGTVFITGTTGGFGAAMARRFAAMGCPLVLHARNAQKLEAVTATLDDAAGVTPVLFDMGDTQAMEEAVRGLPPVDVLINNAGLALGLDPAYAANPADWDEMIDTNIRGLVHLTRLILPQMVERKSGHIINIGSVAGNWPYASGNVYGASKAFVRQFSYGLRCDLHGTGVRVTNIEPGLAETNFSIARFKGDTERAAKVYEGASPLRGEDIAETAAWIACLPPHVNVNSIEVMPTTQHAGGMPVFRG